MFGSITHQRDWWGAMGPALCKPVGAHPYEMLLETQAGVSLELTDQAYHRAASCICDTVWWYRGKLDSLLNCRQPGTGDHQGMLIANLRPSPVGVLQGR